jgi:hypothetical protein
MKNSSVKTNCILCDKPIDNYNPQFNQLKIDDNKSVDICTDCVNKFLKWQQHLMLTLFPTKMAKKMSEPH